MSDLKLNGNFFHKKYQYTSANNKFDTQLQLLLVLSYFKKIWMMKNSTKQYYKTNDFVFCLELIKMYFLYDC